MGVAEDGKYYEIMESQQPVVLSAVVANENGVTIFVVRSPRAQNEMVGSARTHPERFEPNAPITVQSWPDAMAGCAIPGAGGDRRHWASWACWRRCWR